MSLCAAGTQRQSSVGLEALPLAGGTALAGSQWSWACLPSRGVLGHTPACESCLRVLISYSNKNCYF